MLSFLAIFRLRVCCKVHWPRKQVMDRVWVAKMIPGKSLALHLPPLSKKRKKIIDNYRCRGVFENTFFLIFTLDSYLDS